MPYALRKQVMDVYLGFGSHQCTKEENLMEIYRESLFDNTGILHSGYSNSITSDEFKNGTSLFCFDLNPDRCMFYHTHTTMKGSISLELGFKKPTTEAIAVLVYMTFESGVKFNNLMQVIRPEFD